MNAAKEFTIYKNYLKRKINLRHLLEHILKKNIRKKQCKKILSLDIDVKKHAYKNVSTHKWYLKKMILDIKCKVMTSEKIIVKI